MKSPKTEHQIATIEHSEDFENLVNLLALFTATSNELDRLQGSVNEDLTEILDDVRLDYAQLQEAAAKAEAAIELLALKHPEWFTTKKSIRTPYGEVKLRSSTKLEVGNEEAAIERLRLMQERSERAAERAVGTRSTASPTEIFRAADYIRAKEELNLDTLKLLDDSTLATLGIKRVPSENVTVKPAQLDLGKAVKESLDPQPQSQAA